jgi:hypothetical protein
MITGHCAESAESDLGRTFAFRSEIGKVRNRRNLVIAGGSGEGPLTEPTAAACPWAAGTAHVCGPPSSCIANRRFVEFTTYTFGKPSEGQLDRGEGNEEWNLSTLSASYPKPAAREKSIAIADRAISTDMSNPMLGCDSTTP